MDELKLASEWLLSGDTGISSKALCAHMLGMEPDHNMPPSDADDRGRCIRLLNKIPEWWVRLDEMAQYSPQESLVISSRGINTERRGWAEQIPLIRKEATPTTEKENT